MNTTKTLFAAAVLALAGAAFAQDATTADPDMMLTLKKLYPATTFKEVNRTTVPGIYEVVMGQNIAYVDQSGRYFMFGHLYDMQKQEDLTAGKADAASKIDIGQLPVGDAIKTVKGNGARTLYVFSDPECPYCKQLEQNLADLSNVTIYTFLFPLEGLHPKAKGKAVAIWCAQDRAGAWQALMQKGVEPQAQGADCANPVDRNIVLAGRFGITGTPTLIAADGRKLPGAASADRIAQWLDSGSSSGNAKGAMQ